MTDQQNEKQTADQAFAAAVEQRDAFERRALLKMAGTKRVRRERLL